MRLLFVAFVQPVATFLIPGRLFLPYFSGTVLLLIGLPKIIKSGILQGNWIGKAVVLGPLFFAVPMAVFGADHFTFPQIVAGLVPSWIPWHLFWVYFVGMVLIAAALSIVTSIRSVLAATLLSAMLFSFVLLIHVPNLAANPRERILVAILLRDLSFSAGALACALAQADQWPKCFINRVTILVRCIIAVSALFFGIEQFLHPELVPVVPLRQVMPSWIPGQLFLAYVTGAVLIACGLSLVFNWKARQAATSLGIFVFAVVLLVYLPILFANISNIANGLNYFADTLAYSGAILLLARALPSRHLSEARVVSPAEFAGRVNAQQSDMN